MTSEATTKDYENVRDYLLKHELGPKNPAVAAALMGLDEELRKVERDRKLQAKFNVATTTSISNETDDFSRIERPYSTATGKQMDASSSVPPMADDWHDIAKDDDAMMLMDHSNHNSNNTYGSLLAQRVVQSIGDHSVACRTALGGIAVALHATLLQHGFVCTGIPPTTTAMSGFAPPVREIQQFLPLDWEATTNGIKLRYRKTNAVELHTCISEAGVVTVSLGDVSMDVERIEDHINTTSWSKATQNGTKLASPTLHYKSLAKLLGDFAQRFDLGDSVEEVTPKAGILHPSTVPPLHQVPESVPRQPVSTLHDASRPHDPLRMPRTQPSRPYAVGAGDLLPTGLLQYPQRGMPGANFPNQGGNLVGPDHPMFLGGGGGSMDPGMMPRYDPIGPPGGPTELDEMRGARGRKPPGGTGIPNNDMEKRPRFGDNNMFL